MAKTRVKKMIIFDSGFNKDRLDSRLRVAGSSTYIDERRAECGGSIGSFSWSRVERRKEILPLSFG